MNDDKELQIQFPKGKKTLFKNRIFVQETIHPKKKTISFKDLLCRDTHTHTHTHTNQGQILNNIALYSTSPMFSHDQLYIVLSQVTSSEELKILIKNNDNQE